MSNRLLSIDVAISGVTKQLRLQHALFFTPIICLLVAEISAVIVRNGGVFTYTLDDTYITLAIAQRIQHGLYGINAGEFAAPSSSILYPLLLALWPSTVPGQIVFPLVINLVSVLFAGAVAYRLIFGGATVSSLSAICLGLVVAVALNFAGLVTSGMEHGLQLALVALSIWGIVALEQTGRLIVSAQVALVVAPLIRYEDLAITLPACAYLAVLGRWRTGLTIALITTACVGAFSVFLLAHGLDALPSSVLSKMYGPRIQLALRDIGSLDGLSASAITQAVANAMHTSVSAAMLSTVRWNLLDKQAWLLLFLTAPLVFTLASSAKGSEQRLAAFGITAVVLHMFAGHFNWYSRYEIYIFETVILVLGAVYREAIHRMLLPRGAGNVVAVFAPLTFLGISLVLFSRYVDVLRTIPYAASNTYLQQMQMARFVKEYWKQAVGLNDLGAVSFLNDTYILDFGGLASPEVLRSWTAQPYNPLWMDALARRDGVKLSILYMGLPALPRSWTLVAKLNANVPDVPDITQGVHSIGFYATAPTYEAEIRERVRQFAPTLPQGATIEIL